jgi:hypothetical protein
MKQQKIKIGIVGEHPQNDSEALLHLLTPKVCKNVQFLPIVKNLRGSDFDDEENGGASKKFLKLLQSEFIDAKLEKVIFLRDADEIISDKLIQKQHKRDKWFKQATDKIQGKGLFFLAVYEMEALIIADIKTFDKMYNVKTKEVGNPMKCFDPKAHLKKYSAKAKRGVYEEKDAPEIFKKLDFKMVYDKHCGERSFKAFADELKAKSIIDFEIK